MNSYIKKFVVLSSVFASCFSLAKSSSTDRNKKVLIVLTSHDTMGDTGKKTGYWLSELTHPYEIFSKQGLKVDIASIKGGAAPIDQVSYDLKDSVNQKLIKNPTFKNKIDNTLVLKNVDAKNYAAVFYAGGHGTMWDFPKSVAVQKITKEIYETGGIVSAVCHGPAALVNVKLSNGKSLLADKKVTGFSIEEEDAVKLSSAVPFQLETALRASGGQFKKGKSWQNHVVVDQRVVTGQNPASAAGVADAVLKLLD